jgi:hypothetical protein
LAFREKLDIAHGFLDFVAMDINAPETPQAP